MRALVVDDEASNRENLRELLRQFCPGVTEVAEATGVQDGVSMIRQKSPDVVFLDIRMQDGTGFSLLEQLGSVDFEVIFVTAYDQYGIQAIKFAALDYLLKPVDIGELQQAIAKAKIRIAVRQNNERIDYLLQHLNQGIDLPVRIALPLSNETLYVDLDKIIRCESNNSYTWFHLTSGEKVLVSQTLKEYELLLAHQGFVRTHQSHLVNVLFVRSWLKEDGGALLLKDQTKVPVSKLNREKVKAALTNSIRSRSPG
ncbi:response regulator transcription factor [Segetibacter sp. 3557_3]|uniref:LytR/AlgR family response regulator transcription factor n=1 Tax=Segetibacter sp. 3557_3 TaxID=2547429 RepID=UPI0010587870|nr:LytTR family DNA-binding domain-containing protein [Segetibacter sp. 3557_3]TDH23456.1 response regulator transcription factor [Segetibacter sp. 3557_3]